ncbi:hypothetical protein AB1Y20_006857 [Prymnesium parvum]|uniref:Uncharacterized protein n=1 Tax=Prymnesium parvum TaxID=97485 RepID=A0AB34J121_PRYPA
MPLPSRAFMERSSRSSPMRLRPSVEDVERVGAWRERMVHERTAALRHSRGQGGASHGRASPFTRRSPDRSSGSSRSSYTRRTPDAPPRPMCQTWDLSRASSASAPALRAASAASNAPLPERVAGLTTSEMDLRNSLRSGGGAFAVKCGAHWQHGRLFGSCRPPSAGSRPASAPQWTLAPLAYAHSAGREENTFRAAEPESYVPVESPFARRRHFMATGGVLYGNRINFLDGD